MGAVLGVEGGVPGETGVGIVEDVGELLVGAGGVVAHLLHVVGG
jgi:hypothetical protein